MSTPRYEIRAGGEPSESELAAIVVALAPARRVGARTSRPARSGWTRAAIQEGVGRRNFVSADDVDAAALTSP